MDLGHSFLGMLIPLLVAVLTTIAVQGVQKASETVDRLPAMVKRVAVGLIAWGLTYLASKAGITLSTSELGALNEADISALLSAGLAYVFHLSDKLKETDTKAGLAAGAAATAAANTKGPVR